MDFDLSSDEETFRAEVRAFLDENLVPGKARDRKFLGDWLRKVRDKRWVGFSWPKDVGGGGGSLIEQVILNLVLNARDALPGGGRIRIEIGRVAGSACSSARV